MNTRANWAAILGAALAVAVGIIPAPAGLPGAINYQARLLDGTNLYNGPATVVFRVFDDPLAGIEWYRDSNVVTVVDGLYTAVLGDGSGFGDMSWVAGSGTFYLQVDVNGVALVPRERLLSVPYALLAGGVTNGAITTMMIRDGAVMGYHLAGGSVGEAALAKDYRAGSIPVTLSGATETDLSLGQVFSPAFASTPIVTANLDAPGAPADFAPSVTVGARAPTGFSLRVRAPPVGEGAWRAPVLVDTNANTGVALSLAVLGGRPSIAYYEWDGADLFFARAADTNGAGWNKPEPAVTNGDVGFACTLLVVDGRPAISYYNRTGGALDLCYVRSSNALGVGWYAPVTVDSSGDVGGYSSMALIGGWPAIAYYDTTAGDLKFCRAANLTGSAWAAATRVDTNGTTGISPSLAEVSGAPAVAYLDNSGQLFYVRASNAVGSAWGTRRSLLPAGETAERPRLAVVNGQPAVAYRDGPGGTRIRFVRALNATGASWSSPVTVAEEGVAGVEAPSLAVIGGFPAIAYRRNLNWGDLRYAVAHDRNGDTWNAPMSPPIMNDGGMWPSLAELNGRPAIAHHEDAYQDLAFVAATSITAAVSWIAVEP